MDCDFWDTTLVRASFGRDRRLSDFAESALVSCGEEAFGPVRSAYMQRNNGYSIYTVGEFHVPEVEELLTELFLRETKADERTEIGIALCMILPTHALPHILDVVRRGAWSPRVEPLDERLVMAARAADWDPPELAPIRERVDAQRRESLERMNA